MTRDEFLSTTRTERPHLAGFSDDALLFARQSDPRFDPTWIAPVAPLAPVAPALPVAPEPVGLLRRAGDVGAALIGGSAAIGEGVDTLAQLVTRQPEFTPVQSLFELPGRVAAVGVEAAQGRGAEALSSFFATPGVTGTDFAETLKSAAVSRAKTERQRAIADAEPLLGFQQLGEGAAFVRETLTSPTLLIDLLAQTGVQLVPSALAARGAAVAGGALTTQSGRLARFGTWLASEKGTTTAGLVTGALQQGASVAGDSIADLTAGLAAMDPAEVAEIPQIAALMDNGYTLDQAKAALVLNQATKAGIVSTAASLASGAAFGQPLQQALGRWVNRTPRQVAQTSPGLGERVASAARAGAAEGAQEVIEEVSGVVAGNYFSRPVFPDQELFENAGVAGAGGLLGGFMVGGGVSAAGAVADSLTRAEQTQPRGQQVPADRPTAQAEQPATTPATQTPQERFVSFDVEAPTVETPYFVASVDAFDPRANGTVGVAFLGRTAEEAAAKRRAAGFEPIENLSAAQQVELVNRIRAAAPEQPVDVVANSTRLEETFDAQTLNTLRRAKVPDDVLIRLAPEAVVELSTSIRNAGATAEAARQARVAAQALLAESAAGQPVLPGTEEAVLTTGRPVIGAVDTAQPELPTAEPRGQQRLPFPTDAQVRREEAAAQREADLPAAELERELRQDVRARATAARLGSRSIERGLNRIVREEQRGAQPTELKTAPLGAGSQAPTEAPLVAPRATEPTAPPPAPQPPTTMPAGAPVVEPGVTPQAEVTVAPGVLPGALRDVRTTGDQTLTEQPVRPQLRPITGAEVATDYAQGTIAETPAVGSANRPQIVLVFQDSEGTQIGVPVAMRSDKRGGAATPRAILSPLSATEAAKVVVGLERPGMGARSVAAALALEDPRTATEAQRRILDVAESIGYNRWHNKNVETYAIAQDWAYTQRRLRTNEAVAPGLYAVADEKQLSQEKAEAEASRERAPVVGRGRTGGEIAIPKALVDSLGEWADYEDAAGRLDALLEALTDSSIEAQDFTIQGWVADAIASFEPRTRDRRVREAFDKMRGEAEALRAASPEGSIPGSYGGVYARFARAALSAVLEERGRDTSGRSDASRAGGAEVFETRRPLTEAEDQYIESTKPVYTTAMLNDAVTTATMFGFNFILDEARNAMGGRATENTALLFGSYLAKPNVQTFIAMGHEVTHLFLNRARPAVRLAMHRGIDELGKRMAGRRDVDPRVGAGSYEQYLATNPANPLTPEQWATEVVAETAGLNGVRPELARGIFSALLRRLKAFLLDLQLWVQEQIYGPEGVNEETARAWLQTQVDSVIAGDGRALGPYLLQFTPRPTVGQRVQMLTPNSAVWRAQFADPLTGVVTSLPIVGVDPTNVDEAFRAVVSMIKAQSIRTGRVFRQNNLEELPAELQNRELRSVQAITEVRDAQGRLLAPNGQPSRLNEWQWKIVRTPEFKSWFGDWENSPATASKVVDANGEPLVVYHGTKRNKLEFDPIDGELVPTGPDRDLSFTVFNPGSEIGVHFGETLNQAYEFSGFSVAATKFVPETGGAIFPAFLNIRNFVQSQDVFSDRPGFTTKEMRFAVEPRFRAIADQAREVYSDMPLASTPAAEYAEVRRVWLGAGVDGFRYKNEKEGNPTNPGNIAWVALRPEQIKSAIGNNGDFSSADPDIRRTERPVTNEVGREDGTLAARMIKEQTQAKLAALNEMKLPFLAGFNARNASVPVLTEQQKQFLRSQGESFVERLPDTPEGYKAYANEIGIPDPFSAEKYVLEAATRRIEDELGGELPANFFNVTQRVRDLKNAPTFDLAVEEATTAAHTAFNRTRLREQRLKQDVDTYRTEIEKLNRKGNRMVKNPLDWTIVQNETVKVLREYISEIRDNTERIADASGAAQGAAATFNALIDEGERNLVSQETLDRVFDEINLDVAQADGGDTTSFYAVMGAFYRLMLEKNINVAKSNARELRKTITEEVARDPESALRVFTRKGKTGSVQGTALLAAVIDFAKREGQLNEVVRDHAVRANASATQREEIDRTLREFQDVLLNATEESIASLRVKAQTNRHIQQFLNGRDELDKAKAALVKTEFALKATRAAFKMYSQVAKRADANINLHTGWHVAHAAPFVMPRSATESIDEMFSRTRESIARESDSNPLSSEYRLRLYGDNAMSRARLLEIADAASEWLKATAGDPAQLGHKRNLLAIMEKELRHHANNKVANEMVTSLLGVQWRSLEFQLKAAGTDGGAEAARILQQRDANITKYNLEWSARVARKWQTAQQNLQRQSGLTMEEVELRFFRPMTSVSNINMVKDREGFLQYMSGEFANDPVLANIWDRPQVKRAFAEYVEAYAQKAAEMDRMQRDLDAASVETEMDVTDPLTGEVVKAQRRRIERGEITDVSETPEELRNWVAVTQGDAPRTAVFSKTNEARVFNRRSELEPLVAKFLGVSGWDVFLRPLLANPLGGVPAPRGTDGARRTLPTTQTRVLADNANENLFNFIEAAYAGRETQQSLEEYTSDVIDYIGKIWGQVVSQVGRDNAEKTGATPQMLTLPRYGIDARSMRNWPPEWRVGKTGYETEVRSTVEAVSTVAALGAKKERWLAAIKRHTAELDIRHARVEEKMAAILKQQPDSLPKKEQIKRLKGDAKKDYRRLEKELAQIEQYQSTNWDTELMRVLDREQSWMTNNTWALELWSNALVGLVSGLRSALKNPVALLMVPTIGRELSPFSIKTGAAAAGNLGKLLAISFAQITGARPGKGIRTLRAINAVKGVDPANQRKIIDPWTAPDRGVNGNVQGLALLLRRLRTTFSDARLGFSYQGQAPSVRLFNPFAWMQYLTTAAADMTLIDTYEDIVTKLADFENRGGNLADPYTAEDIGFSGSTTELTNWVNMFNSIGSIEVAVKQLNELNRKNDYDNVPEMIVSTAARIAVDYVSGESSVSGNPLVFTQTTGGRLGSALVGWSVRQADKVMRVFTNPQNGRDARAFTNGLVLFGIGLLPPILAYSAFLDWTDELTDRKRNKLPLSQAEGAGQTAKAMLEGVSDVGFAGAGFDIAASVINPQQALSGAGDIFSVDNKIVAVSLLKSFAEAVKNAVAVGPKNWTWTGTGREFAQAFGAAGPMGNFELLNRVTGEWATGLPAVGGIFEAETSRVMRMDAVNNVRSAARGVGLDVRSYSGGSYIPRPWNGHVTNMIYAALRDDRTSFREHYDKAVEAAKGVTPRGEERDTVARAFESRHVWLQTKTRPSPAEIKLMLDTMPPDGREAVIRAADLMNRYGATIGAKPFLGARADTPAAAERAAARRQGMSVEDFRRNRAGF